MTLLHLSTTQITEYHDQRAKALCHIHAYDLSEASYRAMLDSLMQLEDRLRSTLSEQEISFNDDIEAKFAKAADVVTQHATISDLLMLAYQRHLELSGDIWQILKKGGAQIQDVGYIVLPDYIHAPPPLKAREHA